MYRYFQITKNGETLCCISGDTGISPWSTSLGRASLGPKALAPLTVWVAFTVPRTVSLVLPGAG